MEDDFDDSLVKKIVCFLLYIPLWLIDRVPVEKRLVNDWYCGCGRPLQRKIDTDNYPIMRVFCPGCMKHPGYCGCDHI